MNDKRGRSDPVGGKHKGILLSVRVDAELRAAIREHRARLQAASPYRPLTDSDAVRDLLLFAIAAKAGRRRSS